MPGRFAPLAAVAAALACCAAPAGEPPRPPRHDGRELPPPRAAGDPEEPAATKPGALTLDQAIQLVLTADPRVRAGLEAINQAHGDALTASLKPNPVLYADIQMLPLTRIFTPEKTGGPPQQDVLVSYPIDWFLFGKRAAAMASAALGVASAEADYEDLIRQRVAQAASAYYDVVEAKALRRLAEQERRNLERVEALCRQAIKAGKGEDIDLDRVRLEVLNAEQSVRDAEVDVAKTSARLRAFLGRADADPDFDVAARLGDPPRVRFPSAEEAFALALEHRPDLRAAARRAEQGHANIALERARGKPSVTPQLGYTRQYQTRAIGQPDANSWTASVTVPLPWNDRNQGNVARAVATAAQANWNLETAKVDLRAEVETAVRELEKEYRIIRSVARGQLVTAARVRDHVSGDYGVGDRELVDVLDALRTYRATYQLYINSRCDFWQAVFALDAAVGRRVVTFDAAAAGG